jgi:hypothetical protein
MENPVYKTFTTRHHVHAQKHCLAWCYGTVQRYSTYFLLRSGVHLEAASAVLLFYSRPSRYFRATYRTVMKKTTHTAWCYNYTVCIASRDRIPANYEVKQEQQEDSAVCFEWVSQDLPGRNGETYGKCNENARQRIEIRIRDSVNNDKNTNHWTAYVSPL